MSTTHIGKIGRLSRDIRQLLGEQIEEGIPNKELVAWLNEAEAVKQVLAMRFGGRAITEQNLSEWKQSGHLEWLRREERRALALQLLEARDAESMEPEEMAAEQEVSDRLGRELGLEMARLALALVEQDGSTEDRWQRLCGVYREVSRLRRDDERGDRTRIQRERWERERAEAEEKERRWQAATECLEPVREAIRTYRTEAKANGRRRTELSRRSKRKGKNDECTGVRPPMPNGGEGTLETSGGNIQQPTFNAQRPGELQAQEAPSTNIQAPEKSQASMEQVESEAPNAEEIQPNPSKSNQYTDEENEAWLRKMNFI